jgi:fructokinase
VIFVTAESFATGGVVVAGEVMIDLVPEPDGRFRAAPGGSPATVAIGLARLGTPTQLIARIGSGALANSIREYVAANGVGLTHAVEADEHVAVAFVSVDDGGRARHDIYADGAADWLWSPDELPDPLPDATLAFYTGSVAAARQPGSVALLQLLRREHARNRVSIVLDPNPRPGLLGEPEDVREHWDALIELADVIKTSDEDLAWLVPGIDPFKIAKGWAECGPALIVVTRGAHGAFAVTSEGTMVSSPACDVEVTDTVGAGDAFTAGLVDSLRRCGLLGAPARQQLAELPPAQLREILDRAGRVAALTCERLGADPPTAAQLDHPDRRQGRVHAG